MNEYSIEQINKILKQIKDYDLDVPDNFDSLDINFIQQHFNGVGSDLTPEWQITILDFTFDLFLPAVLLHDIDFTFSNKSIKGFQRANLRLYNNCFKIINTEYPFSLFNMSDMAERAEWVLKAEAVYKAVSEFGLDAWKNAMIKNK